jgi:predicted amidophosphoribosyltransferase
MKSFTVEKMPKIELACPFCHLHTLISHGINMVCNNCGKTIKTIKNAKPSVKGKYENCFYCGSDDTILNGGLRLICKNCGRSFKKRALRRQNV